MDKISAADPIFVPTCRAEILRMGRFNLEISLSWLYLLSLCYARAVNPASEFAAVSRSDNGLNFKRYTKRLQKQELQSVVAAPISAAYALVFSISLKRRLLILPASRNTGKATMAHGRLLSSKSAKDPKKFACFLQLLLRRPGWYLKILDATMSPSPIALRLEARRSILASAPRGRAIFNGRSTSSASMNNCVTGRLMATTAMIP